jgi:hypothetical protein
MALSTRDLERLRAVIERGEGLPSSTSAPSSALVSGEEAVTPLVPPAAPSDDPASGETEDRRRPSTIYERLRRARPVRPHRLDPEPWTPPPATGAEPEPAQSEPIDYAARAASAAAAPPDAPTPAPEPSGEAACAGPTTAELLETRAAVRAAREVTRGPAALRPPKRAGPYDPLV